MDTKVINLYIIFISSVFHFFVFCFAFHISFSFRDNKHPLLKKNELILDKMQKTMLEMSACAISLSLACVMAGSGDIECLRIFRELRWRIEDVVYGSQQAFSMAIGKWFLVIFE